MRLVGIFVVLAMVTSSVSAGDLFNDGKPMEFVKGAAVEPATTIGGYAMLHDVGTWHLLDLGGTMSATQGDAQSIKRGYATMLQVDTSGAVVGSLSMAVNLTTTGQNQFTLGTPCGGTHIVTLKKGAGVYDNCMTIDADSFQSQSGPATFFSIKVTQTRSGGRIYVIDLRLVADVLGFSGTRVSDWSEDALGDTKDRAALIQRMKAWGEQLQDATGRAIDFSKPADAFAAVPSYRTLIAAQ